MKMNTNLTLPATRQEAKRKKEAEPTVVLSNAPKGSTQKTQTALYQNTATSTAPVASETTNPNTKPLPKALTPKLDTGNLAPNVQELFKPQAAAPKTDATLAKTTQPDSKAAQISTLDQTVLVGGVNLYTAEGQGFKGTKFVNQTGEGALVNGIFVSNTEANFGITQIGNTAMGNTTVVDGAKTVEEIKMANGGDNLSIHKNTESSIIIAGTSGGGITNIGLENTKSGTVLGFGNTNVDIQNAETAQVSLEGNRGEDSQLNSSVENVNTAKFVQNANGGDNTILHQNTGKSSIIATTGGTGVNKIGVNNSEDSKIQATGNSSVRVENANTAQVSMIANEGKEGTLTATIQNAGNVEQMNLNNGGDNNILHRNTGKSTILAATNGEGRNNVGVINSKGAATITTQGNANVIVNNTAGATISLDGTNVVEDGTPEAKQNQLNASIGKTVGEQSNSVFVNTDEKDSVNVDLQKATQSTLVLVAGDAVSVNIKSRNNVQDSIFYTNKANIDYRSMDYNDLVTASGDEGKEPKTMWASKAFINKIIPKSSENPWWNNEIGQSVIKRLWSLPFFGGQG